MKRFCSLALALSVGCNAQEEKATVAVNNSRPPQAWADTSQRYKNRAADTLQTKAIDEFLNPAQFKVAKLDTFKVKEDADKLVRLTAAEERKYLQQPIVHSIYTPYHFYSGEHADA